MFPDIGLLELMVLVGVIIVVVGPKELPQMMRNIGEWVGKARSMAREFQRSLEEMAREAELAELREEMDALRKDNPISKLNETISGSIDPNEPFYPPGGDDPETDEPNTEDEGQTQPAAKPNDKKIEPQGS